MVEYVNWTCMGELNAKYNACCYKNLAIQVTNGDFMSLLTENKNQENSPLSNEKTLLFFFSNLLTALILQLTTEKRKC